MRAVAWGMVVLGLVGAVACAYGLVVTNQTTDRAQEAAGSLGAQARALIDAVDGKLVDVPGRVTQLVERKDEGEVARQLGRLEETLASTYETGTTILSLLRVASRLRGGQTVEDEFPKVVALHATLGAAHGMVRDQRADVKTWTLRAVALNRLLDGVRSDLEATRAQTERIETRTVDTLGTLALWTSIFLVWMGAGQIALAALGRRRAQAVEA